MKTWRNTCAGSRRLDNSNKMNNSNCNMFVLQEGVMPKFILSYQVGFGLVAGVAAGVVVYVVHRQRQRNLKKKATKQNGYHVLGTADHDHSLMAGYFQGLLYSVTYHQFLNIQCLRLQKNYKLCFISASSANTDVVAASRSEQLELLNRLDYVLGSIAELRQEIESLRSILHGLAEEVVGEVRWVNVRKVISVATTICGIICYVI